MNRTVTLIIPAYNEEENVEPFFRRCREVFDRAPYDIEYIFINDGSSDGTYNNMKALAAVNPAEDIHIVSFSRNFGKEAAMVAGLERSSGDYTVIIDIDLQQDPAYVLRMARALDENADTDCVVCYAARRAEARGMRFFKKLFYKVINKISDIKFEENASDFRMMRRNMVSAVLEMKEYYRFSKGLFQWVGFNTRYMPYEVQDRQAGKSKWSFRQLIRYAVDGFAGFSTAPLKVSSWIGMVGAAIAVIYFIVVLIQKLVWGISISGYATIVCLILLIGGVQMILMGIMGEYIARTYIEVKNRPAYIVKEEHRGQEKTYKKQGDKYNKRT